MALDRFDQYIIYDMRAYDGDTDNAAVLITGCRTVEEAIGWIDELYGEGAIYGYNKGRGHNLIDETLVRVRRENEEE